MKRFLRLGAVAATLAFAGFAGTGEAQAGYCGGRGGYVGHRCGAYGRSCGRAGCGYANRGCWGGYGNRGRCGAPYRYGCGW